MELAYVTSKIRALYPHLCQGRVILEELHAQPNPCTSAQTLGIQAYQMRLKTSQHQL